MRMTNSPARGYGYGPAFRGLRGIWRREDEIFAEVAVPDEGVAVDGFGIHPVVLDAALHAMGVVGELDSMVLPFSWQGVSLHAAGASRVRVRIAPADAGAVSVELADGAGLPVLSVQSLVMRPVSLGAVVGRRGALCSCRWGVIGGGMVSGVVGRQRCWGRLGPSMGGLRD